MIWLICLYHPFIRLVRLLQCLQCVSLCFYNRLDEDRIQYPTSLNMNPIIDKHHHHKNNFKCLTLWVKVVSSDGFVYPVHEGSWNRFSQGFRNWNKWGPDKTQICISLLRRLIKRLFYLQSTPLLPSVSLSSRNNPIITFSSQWIRLYPFSKPQHVPDVAITPPFDTIHNFRRSIVNLVNYFLAFVQETVYHSRFFFVYIWIL